MTISFDRWFHEFHLICKNRDWPMATRDCYLDYYQSDFTPQEAFDEELSCCDKE